mgnify:CR=1 FL=1
MIEDRSKVQVFPDLPSNIYSRLLMKDKEYFLKELRSRGYDNPKLSDLSEVTLKEILKNEESFYIRNSS